MLISLSSVWNSTQGIPASKRRLNRCLIYEFQRFVDSSPKDRMFRLLINFNKSKKISPNFQRRKNLLRNESREDGHELGRVMGNKTSSPNNLADR